MNCNSVFLYTSLSSYVRWILRSFFHKTSSVWFVFFFCFSSVVCILCFQFVYAFIFLFSIPSSAYNACFSMYPHSRSLFRFATGADFERQTVLFRAHNSTSTEVHKTTKNWNRNVRLKFAFNETKNVHRIYERASEKNYVCHNHNNRFGSINYSNWCLRVRDIFATLNC